VELGAELEARGLQTETVALSEGNGTARLPIPALGSTPLGLMSLRGLRQRARRARVVVAHGSRTLPACVIALVGTGRPFVYRNIGDPRRWTTTWSRTVRTRVFLSRAARVVALTDAAAAEMERRYHVSAEKFSVIPNGASATRHRPCTPDDRAAARRALGLADDATVLVVVGALSSEKGVDLAISALAHVPSVNLVVVGDGPQRGALEDLASSIAAERVHFTGALDSPGVAFEAADLLVLPSRTEGLPGVLIEAGLRGLPSVATDVGYVRDIILDGETGIVVDAGDATALADGLARAFHLTGAGQAALEHCRREFELGEIAERWYQLLRSIVR
jgi:glycosyltransferase involved in cell wall biosynthesis